MAKFVRQYAKLQETKRNSSLLIQRTKSSQSIKTPADRILFLQRTIGNQAVQRLIKSGTLQAKLKIGQPGDKYELEADRVADEVMRMPEPGVQRQVEPEEEETLQPKPLASQITPPLQVQRQEEPEEDEETLQAKPLTEEITPLVQRQVELEEEEEEEELQAKLNSGRTSEIHPILEYRIQSLKGGGQPLSANERTFFEPRFGCDFSHVRVHTDTRAAQAMNAQAFTMGKNVVFGEGQYISGTDQGHRLMAHELVHVMQQKSTANGLNIQCKKTGEITYVVKPGESLKLIVEKFGIKINDLIAENAHKLKTWGKIQGFEAGETINIPNALIKKSIKEKQPKKKLPKKVTKPQSTKGRARMLECYDKCGGSELGNTECEIDLNTGLPSGKVIYEIFNKSLFTGHCTNVHEIVHSKDIRGICRNVRNCLDKAGKNIKKQDICLDKYEYDSYAIAPITECNAYKASIKCLEERKSADSCVTKKGRIQWKKQMSLEKCYKNCYCKK